MIKEIIKNEVMNDGKSIFLYFNNLIGLYTAYGYSAFILAKIVNITPSYSNEVQMPVVVLDRDGMELLVKLAESQGNPTSEIRYFKLEKEVDMNDYSDWAADLRELSNIR